MRYFPVNIDLMNKICIVVGGGVVGTRKVKALLRCGAKVTVVSKRVTRELEEMAGKNLVRIVKRPYRKSDLSDAFLVIGATDDMSVNRKVSEDAASLNILCNIADQPQLCSFILPAVVSRGDLTIAVSTSGKSPALAKFLRKRLEMEFGEEYSWFLEIMGEIRAKMLAGQKMPGENKKLFKSLVESELIYCLKERDAASAEGVLRRILGPDFVCESLAGDCLPEPGEVTKKE